MPRPDPLQATGSQEGLGLEGVQHIYYLSICHIYVMWGLWHACCLPSSLLYLPEPNRLSFSHLKE